jgi:hypothetical protein
MNLQGWEIGLLAVAAFVAITAMVRLMRQRRDQLTNELLSQAEAEHRRQAEEERKAKIKQKKAG